MKKQDRRQHAAPAAKVGAVQELRRSGAAGKHDPRPKRLRTRQAAKAAALREF